MDNIKDIATFYKEKVCREVFEILDSLEDDYDLEVMVDDGDVYLIIDEFYNYYEELGIVYEFCSSMIGHFNDIAIMAIENDCTVDREFFLRGLELFELCDSAVEVDPIKTNKVLDKIRSVSAGGNL